MCDTVLIEDGPYCDVCGESHWYNFFVPDDVWEQIAPLDYVPGGGGILCVRCIDKRCVELRIKTVGRFYFTGKAVSAPASQPATTTVEAVWLASEYTEYEGGGVDEVFADYELGLVWLGAKREMEIATHEAIDIDTSFIEEIQEEDGLAYVDVGSTRYSIQRWEPKFPEKNDNG